MTFNEITHSENLNEMISNYLIESMELDEKQSKQLATHAVDEIFNVLEYPY